jgi:hypothetical protein
MHTSMGFETPEPIVYPPLPPTVEYLWAWYRNVKGSDEEEDDDDDEIEEESE